MTQPQGYPGTIRLLPAPRPPFSQIVCFGRGASQVVGSFFLRRGTPCPSRQRMGPNTRRRCGAPVLPCWAQVVLPLQSIPHLACQITWRNMQMDRINSDWLGLPLIGRAAPQSLRALSGARRLASYDRLRLPPTAVAGLRIGLASFRT